MKKWHEAILEDERAVGTIVKEKAAKRAVKVRLRCIVWLC